MASNGAGSGAGGERLVWWRPQPRSGRSWRTIPAVRHPLPGRRVRPRRRARSSPPSTSRQDRRPVRPPCPLDPTSGGRVESRQCDGTLHTLGHDRLRLDKAAGHHVASDNHGQTPRDRRVAGKGEDDRQIPWRCVRRARLGGARRRPAVEGSCGRRGQRVQADLRAHRARQAGGEGPQAGAEGCQRALPGHRRGPRG